MNCTLCDGKLITRYLDRLGFEVPFCPNCGESHEGLLIDAELKGTTKRSEIFREGMFDGLHSRTAEAQSPYPYEPGSVEFDAWTAGVDRGHRLLRIMKSGHGAGLLVAAIDEPSELRVAR